MSDELDPVLLRAFAYAERPFADPAFVARVAAQLRPHASLRGVAEALISAVDTTLRGLAAGLAAPLRMRYAGVVAIASMLIAVWSLIPPV